MRISIVPVDRLELIYAPRPWAFAAARRAEIDEHFAELRRAKPALWNGRVLLLHRHEIIAGCFRGAFLETDYASFLAWRDWTFPDTTVTNGFAMAAIRSADGAFLLGVMGPHTAAAGLAYFPAGTPEPRDVVGKIVDLDAGLRREVAEETGFSVSDLVVEPGWHAVDAGPRVALIKSMRTALAADALAARVRDYLARENDPELADVRLVRESADLDGAVPAFVAAFLSYVWAGPSSK
jgi:8-oxo-dGTP pyrophosphatase MutT (NUDIX family)